MANTNTITVELKVNDKGTVTIQNFADNASTHLKKVEGAGTSMGAGFAKTWQGMAVGLNMGMQLFQQLASIATVPIEAYMESERALLKMGMAMKNQGDFSRAALADMEHYAAELQETTAYEDDATLSIMANLKSYGMSNEQVKMATKAALDLATAKATEGMTIEKASEIMGKSYLGISTGLKKLGIQVDSTASKSELFNSVMGQVQDRFGGSAQAELLTYSGQWKQLHNQWKDVQEFLGLVFLKTIESVGFTMSMMGAGFWTVVETMLKGLSWLTDNLGKFANFIGLEKVSNGIGVITDALRAGATNAKEAEGAAIKNADANYKNMMSFDKVSGAIDKMGIAGKKTTGQFKEDEKVQEDILKSLEATNKERYESAISEADRWLMHQREAGANELTSSTAYYDKKAAASRAWYDKEWADISEHTVRESVKNAKLTELNAKYEKTLGDDKTKREKAEIDYAQKRIDTEANLYKTINEYSEDSVKATITALEKKYKEEGRSTQKTEVLAAALADAEKQIYLNRDRVVYDYYSKTQVYAEDAEARLAKLAQEEYDRVYKATQNAKVAAKAQSDYLIDAKLKEAAAENDFFAGVEAQRKKDLQNQMTWGKAGIQMMATTSTAMASSFSNIFFDGIKGKFTKLEDYGTAFADTILKKWTDIMGQMAAEKITMFFAADWKEGANAVLGIVNKILGWADPSWAGFAKGGEPPVGKPYWVGEKGPELLFSEKPGYVMEHNQSVAYAARNGGYIPGRAEGGMINAAGIPTQFYHHADMWGQGIEGLDTAALAQYYNDMGITPAGLGDMLYTLPGFNPAGKGMDYYSRESLHSYAKATGQEWALDAGYWSGTGNGVDWNPQALWAQKRGGDLGFIGDIGHYLNEEVGGFLDRNARATAQVASIVGKVAMVFAASNPAWGGNPAFGASVAAGLSATGSAYSGESFGPAALKATMSAIVAYIAASLMIPGPATTGTGMGTRFVESAELAAFSEKIAAQTAAEAAGQASVFGVPQFVADPMSGVLVTNPIYPLAYKGLQTIIKSSLQTALSGGGGAGMGNNMAVSFAGMSGGDPLRGLLDIAPQSRALSARNGLNMDYVPYDNFLINTHEGEGVTVTPKGENKKRLSEKGGGVNLTINLTGTIIDRKAVNEFAEMIYPQLKKLEAWGH